MGNKFWNWALILFLSSVVNLGTVRKKEDPILDTQTNPIGYKQKMEEIKDGEKGAPSPSFKHYTKAGFLTDPSLESKGPDATKDQELPAPDDVLPEDLSDEQEESSEELSEDNWVDDWDEELDPWDEIEDENSFKNAPEMDEAGK